MPPVVTQAGPYVGRFAPSPTGPLHAGSLVAALASWLDARAHFGRWLVRIEDVDTPRQQAGAEGWILRQLQACGLIADEPPIRQSQRSAAYDQALQGLKAQGLVYRCSCTRRQIEAHWAGLGRPTPRDAETVYPGTCRSRTDVRDDAPHALRLRCGSAEHPVVVDWVDRRLGLDRQDVTACVGDVVLRRADGVWAYQLAVVVDDAASGITHVVRGEDLADNTPRQIHLQGLLGLPTPRYLHTPLVRAADGRKLSKQNGAAALDTTDPLAALRPAAAVLGLAPTADRLEPWLAESTAAWARRWVDPDRAGAGARPVSTAPGGGGWQSR
jgi:glutamyl-Q tRNA(Asp) synthetase